MNSSTIMFGNVNASLFIMARTKEKINKKGLEKYDKQNQKLSLLKKINQIGKTLDRPNTRKQE